MESVSCQDMKQNLHVKGIRSSRLTDSCPTAVGMKPYSTSVVTAIIRKCATTANMCSKKLLCSVEKSKAHKRKMEFNDISKRSFSP